MQKSSSGPIATRNFLRAFDNVSNLVSETYGVTLSELVETYKP